MKYRIDIEVESDRDETDLELYVRGLIGQRLAVKDMLVHEMEEDQ